MRFLTKEQITRLLFWERGKQERATRESVCQRRLTRLYHNGYLNRFYMTTIPGQGGSPAVYYLGATGKRYLKGLGINAKTINKPGQRIQMFLDHTLAVNDVWIEVEKMHREGVWKLVHWMTPTDIIGEKKRIPAATGQKWIVPDGLFFVVEDGKQKGFYVEVDRGTMTAKRFGMKVSAYIHYRTGGHFERASGFKNMRVIITVPTETRLLHLKKAVEGLGGRNLFWLIVESSVRKLGFGAAYWRIAGTERDAYLF